MKCPSLFQSLNKIDLTFFKDEAPITEPPIEVADLSSIVDMDDGGLEDIYSQTLITKTFEIFFSI